MSGTSQIAATRQALLDALAERFLKRQLGTVERVLDVATKAHHGSRRGTGEPYVCHEIEVAKILTSWNLDLDTIVAAILHDVPEDTSVSLADISRQFGQPVAHLVEAVTKLSNVRVPDEESGYDVENLRHLFLAMAKDLRVILLKLADRLHNMRTLKGVVPVKRPRIARETLEIYAPLADLLGMGEVRSELDDLGFRYADPREYQWTKRQVQQTERKRANYLTRVKHEFERVLADAGITVTINARTKNMYSLYRKLVQKERDIDKIYDLFAIRIIVDSIEECYQGMGVIHRHWQPLPHRVKDYIAVPKLNGYRSLHTTIFGPDDRLLEVQLRTSQMHEEAEHGVAAHTVYAEGKQSVPAAPEQQTVLRQLTSWQADIRESTEFVDRLKLDMFSDRIFVFTPKGALHNLPAGSTPVDFAYQVHTEIGHTLNGAKVNGVMVPLETKLDTGDVVEILTRRGSVPKRDWLSFVRTGSARNHIRSYFRKLARADNLKAGRLLFDQALQRAQLPKSKLLEEAKVAKLVAVSHGAKNLEDVWVMLGEGTVALGGLLRVLEVGQPTEPKARPSRSKPLEPTSVTLSGMGSLLTKRALCCNPKRGEAIVGYVTVGRGVSIHRAACPSLKNLPDRSRLVQLRWDSRT